MSFWTKQEAKPIDKKITINGPGTLTLWLDNDDVSPEEVESALPKIMHALNTQWALESSAGKGALAVIEHYRWLCGINDSMKIVKDRKRFLQSLGPAATPKSGVIEILDEVLVQLKAMHDRGSYSSSSPMMTVMSDHSDGETRQQAIDPQLAVDLKQIKEQVGRWGKLIADGPPIEMEDTEGMKPESFSYDQLGRPDYLEDGNKK
jgi:hypothetical protein